MKANKAFTLVELIIVIAVIGVLAAILIPVFADVIEKANNKSALTDAKNALEIYIADAVDYTGGLVIGEGSVFKIRKANKDWYFTYYENTLHEGSGAENADALRPLPVPSGSTKIMSDNSYYISERDAETVISENLPDTVIIYNTGADAVYTPPAEEDEYDGEYILIRKASQLTNEFFASHGMDKKYKLKNSIALSGEFTPIDGVFTGEFNGNGKTVSGLAINEPTTENTALFRQVNGASLYGFNLSVNSIIGKSNVGTVCSAAYNSTFTDIHVNITGNVTDAYDSATANRVGGFCAFASAVTISRCSVKGRVSSETYICNLAGFCSHLSGTMSECFFSGTLSGDVSGGLAAMLSNGTIRDCYSRVAFENASQVSGIANIGINDTSNRIQNCVTVCTGFTEDEFAGTVTSAGFVINYHHATEVVNCYMLENDELAQHPYYMSGYQNESVNGTTVAAFSQANCPALNSLGNTLWSFSGAYPTLVNNPEG